ncbi:sensor histidine kinase [Micromonospora echinofusca]|uniref:sensor histidine kinase n=1 Tax=Micromonospora echinofusca TaxID=47858 RepID=UPI001AD6D8DF|nr:histidine kinase [Micromonospora echinofusca]
MGRVDLLLAAGSLAGGLVLYGIGTQPQVTPHPGLPPRLFLLTLAAVCVAVGLRRVAPRSSLALGSTAVLGDVLLGGSLGTLLVYTQVLYDACVYGPPRLWRWLLRVTVGLSVLGALAGVVGFGHWRGIAVGIPVVLVGVLPVLTGVSVRQHRDQSAAERDRVTAERDRAAAERDRAAAERDRAAIERDRAEQAARLAELDRRQAVGAERARMARELHDVVANHLSAVAIHATAVLSVPGLDRGQVEQALRVIRENSVQGLAEMRQMIGLLREPATDVGAVGTDVRVPGAAGTDVGAVGEPDGPAAGATRVRLAEVDRLVDRMRATGLAVRVRARGAAGPLPVNVDLAAYRIVQESLTNALKHGSGEAVLTVEQRPDRVVVLVENPVPEGAAPTGADPAGGRAGLTGPGAGLIGMRERAVLLGGRFEAGRAGDRWRVRADLPTGATGPGGGS